MIHYVALLRGINVGGKAKIDMKILKQLTETLGFLTVRTYINSGNILFFSDLNSILIKTLLETSIENYFGVKITVTLFDQAMIKNLCQTFPKSWTNDALYKTDILFLNEAYDHPSSLNLINPNPEVDHLIYAQGAIGWHIERQLYAQSRMSKFIGSPLYKNMTARNITTLRKINALLNGD